MDYVILDFRGQSDGRPIRCSATRSCLVLFLIFQRLRMLNLVSLATFFLFFLECYHIIGHLNVFLRIRLLPRRDLLRIRVYFLSEALSICASSFLLLHREHKLLWPAALHIVQHLYYFLYWEKTAKAKKVINLEIIIILAIIM